jgi:hypothetical protein
LPSGLSPRQHQRESPAGASCASDSYKFQLQSAIDYRDQSISGTWSESTRQVGGGVRSDQRCCGRSRRRVRVKGCRCKAACLCSAGVGLEAAAKLLVKPAARRATPWPLSDRAYRKWVINVASSANRLLPLIPRFRTYRCVAPLGDQQTRTRRGAADGGELCQTAGAAAAEGRQPVERPVASWRGSRHPPLSNRPRPTAGV